MRRIEEKPEGMELGLLGPVEVIGDDGLPVALGGPRPRALLALLLLHPNQPSRPTG